MNTTSCVSVNTISTTAQPDISARYRDHWIVGHADPVSAADTSRPALTRHEAWLWMWGEAARRGGRIVMSAAGLAKSFNWTVMTVRWFLDRLEKCGLIVRTHPGQRSRRTTVISIVDQAPLAETAMERKVRAAFELSQTMRRAS